MGIKWRARNCGGTSRDSTPAHFSTSSLYTEALRSTFFLILAFLLLFVSPIFYILFLPVYQVIKNLSNPPLFLTLLILVFAAVFLASGIILSTVFEKPVRITSEGMLLRKRRLRALLDFSYESVPWKCVEKILVSKEWKAGFFPTMPYHELLVVDTKGVEYRHPVHDAVGLKKSLESS